MKTNLAFKKLALVGTIILVGLILVFIIAANTLRNFTKGNAAEFFPNPFSSGTKPEPAAQKETTTGTSGVDPFYSFELDQDSDGLSNAKEFIYGTNPYISDTDGDGITDGNETASGWDPLLAGKTPLSQRAQSNMTIEYLLWASQKTKNSDPPLDTKLIDGFLSQKLKIPLKLPEVRASEIVLSGKDDKDSVRAYLSALDGAFASFPKISYLETANESFRGRNEALEQTLRGLASTQEAYKKIPTPASAFTVQKTYVAFFQFLETIFLDIRRIKEDPVRVIYNSKRGGELVSLLQNLEQQKASLLR